MDTLFVLDVVEEGDQLYCPTPVHINLKNKKTSNESTENALRIERPVISVIYAAVVEYSRILFDLFPTVPATDKNAQNQHHRFSILLKDRVNEIVDPSHSEWQGTPQNVRRLIKWLQNNKFPRMPIYQLIHQVFEILKDSSKTSDETPKRIIILLQPTGEEVEVDNFCHINYGDNQKIHIPNLLNQFIAEYNHTTKENKIKPCEISIIHISQKSIELKPVQLLQLPFVSAKDYSIEADLLFESLQDLACIHFNLRSIRITGIPMKTEGERARNTYDVVLLHPQENHALNRDETLPLGKHETMESSELTLQWKTADKSLKLKTLLCDCVHRLTPLCLSSSPSQCLTRYLIGQKPVTLIPISESKNKAISHLILLQGNQMYLHCLRSSVIDIQDPVISKYLSCYSKTDSTLRASNFSDIIKSNTLHPSTDAPSIEFSNCSLKLQDQTIKVESTPNILQSTMGFTYHSSASVLFRPLPVSNEFSKTLLTLRNYFTKSDPLSPHDISNAQAIMRSIMTAKQTNEISYFPNTTAPIRKQSYDNLLMELTLLCNRSKTLFANEKAELFTLFEKSISTPVNPELPADQQPTNKSNTTDTQTTPHRSNSPTRSGSNAGDLTHSGSTLEQERKRKKFNNNSDPFEFVDSNSLFATFWGNKLNHISTNCHNPL